MLVAQMRVYGSLYFQRFYRGLICAAVFIYFRGGSRFRLDREQPERAPAFTRNRPERPILSILGLQELPGLISSQPVASQELDGALLAAILYEGRFVRRCPASDFSPEGLSRPI